MATAFAFDPRTAPIAFAQLGDFAAVDAATKALHDAGFSVGSMQAHAPRGLLLGNVAIAKWRNLSHQERLVLDGEMHGGRAEPVTIVPSAAVDEEVLAAFDRVRAAAFDAAGQLTRRLANGMIVDA